MEIINSALRVITRRFPAIHAVTNTTQRVKTSPNGPAPESGHDPLFSLSVVWRKCMLGKAIFSYCRFEKVTRFGTKNA